MIEGESTMEIHRTISLDEGLNILPDSVASMEKKDECEKKNEASEFLAACFGEILTNILIECSIQQPPDPILFIAKRLEE